MENILLNRLRLIHDKMKSDSSKIPDTLSRENLLQGQIAYGKLEATLKRFSEDLNEYFRLVTTPASDDISQMSVTQLDAEETLAELGVKLNNIQTETKNNRKEDVNKSTNFFGKLPKLDLPTFDGNVLNWHQFWDQFSSSIDTRNLSNVDKLAYLKASVSGEAKKAIDGLETANRNYEIALSTLKERYGKTSHLIDAHYSTCYKINRKTQQSTLSLKFLQASSAQQTYMTSDRNPTILQTAAVKVSTVGDINNQIKCRVLLDSGSQRSYVTWKVAKDLNLPVEEESKLIIFTFGADKPREIRSPVVKIQMQTRTSELVVLHANCVEFISRGGIPHQELFNLREAYLLADDGSLNDQVDILVGNDYYFSTVYEEKKKLGENLFLVNSAFGWILSGQIEFESINEFSVITYAQTNIDVGLSQPDSPLDSGYLKKLWELDSIRITDSPKANRDEEAIKYFNETTQRINNRYIVSWPWIEYPPDLPNNFGLAFGRLISLLKRVDRHTLSAYDQTLKEQLNQGIIEIVPDSTKGSSNDVIHYLPHHGVQQAGKPIRIVYDASSKCSDSKSLNECLYCGPMLLEDLTGLIIKFRCFAIGLTADVEKVFLQIGLKEQDRDVTRFLWIKNINKPAKEDNLVHLRFTRVPFGIISSPFILNATVKHHLLKAENRSVKQLANDIYVDNLVTGTNTVEEALELYRNSKETFQEISMNLRQWSSNSEEFMRSIHDACTERVVKILGLDWHLQEDTLHLRTKVVNNANTKRGILKSVASIYDPCGYAVPTLLSAKLLLQDLWKMKIKWDTPLSIDIVNKWNDIQEDLNKVKDISLARHYITNDHNNDCQIHCFTDASTRAYAAVVYVVGKHDKGFVIGKSRLVPIKDQENLKIPRLELLGVLIGSRLINYTLKFIKFNITQQVLWTDSQIVIDWFNSNKLLTPFVSKRIQEIKRNTNLTIRYVPSDLNPADSATRPTSSNEDREKWLAGPDFLLQEPGNWPLSSSKEHSLLVGEDLTKPNEEKCPEAMDAEFNDDCGDSSKEQEAEIELQDSTLREIKKIQAKYFEEEVNGKETSLGRNLGLFKDIDGILRCKGRMKYADWSYDKRYPILIPRDTDFTNKIITKTHSDNYHVGANHTLSIIRQSYWIPQGKSQVQRILRKCPSCNKHGGGPYKLPPTPALPQERVNYSSPFTFVGADYLGPLFVNNGNGNCKRWICLYTCLAVRAIHLEVVCDLTAEEGLLALRRMISSRGVPALITSDNAANFKLMSKILENGYCIDKKIRWKFIPQLAPWYGGFYERLVGIVKNCMKRTLQKHLLRDNQLVTVVKEIEAVINTRPLTYVDSELDHVLKPSDFLTMGQCITMDASQENSAIEGSATRNDLVKSWRRALVILQEFKEMFTNRYLPSLRERYWHGHREPRVTSKLVPKEGQIVQIKGDSKNRTGWKVGKMVSIKKGDDGLCRVAKVKVGNTELTRSIAHIYPLKIEEGEENCIKIIEDEPHDRTSKLPVCELQSMDGGLIERALDDTNTQDLTKETNDDEVIQAHCDGKSTRDKSHKSTEFEATNRTEPESEPKSVELKSKDSIEPESKEEGQEVRPRRAAAMRALEKIQEWTRNLTVVLQPFVGSVATSAI